MICFVLQNFFPSLRFYTSSSTPFPREPPFKALLWVLIFFSIPSIFAHEYLYSEILSAKFYVLLTLHPNIIFLNKPTWCTIFLIYLFIFSTCLGQLCTYHQENQLYQCDTWYMTVWYVGRNKIPTHIPDIYQVSQWYTWFSWWWAHRFPKHVEDRNK